MAKKKSSALNKKQKLMIIIISPLAILAVVLVILDIYSRQAPKLEFIDEEIDLIVDEEIDEEISMIVPDPDSQLSQEQRQVMAVPERAVSSNPSSGTLSQNRSFSFNLENNNLTNIGDSGKEINVYQYDNITLYFTALDRDYDIHLPNYFGQAINIAAGETARRRFQAVRLGSSPYYCGVCGGPESEASGLIIVHSRPSD